MAKVYLIGAGPGDEELITLKAIRVLKKCTAVMYDRLAGPGILKYLNEDCEIYYCGKEPGCHYKTQEEINEMLVGLAKKGHVVGRIKGGDPYVFGRGGEEALALIEEGIEFETVPGITSAISVLSYAGIPVTHRAIAQSFHIFTGMTAEKANINWSGAAKSNGTLIFLMGFRNFDIIKSRLMENGVSEDTPAAIVMRGTTSKQKKVIGTLKNVKEKAIEAGITSPCIIVVGEVVQFHDQFNWYEKKPLFGQNICITRSKEQSQEIKEKLIDLGAQVTEINTIKIVNTNSSLDAYKDKIESYDYIALTSVNGVNVFFDYLINNEIDLRNIKAKFCAIGPATARALKEKGILPFIVAEEFVAEDLFEKMKEYIKSNDKVLLPRSAKSRAFLKEALIEKGCSVDEAHTYDIEKGASPEEGVFDEVDTVLFTSPTTVKNLIAMVGLDKVSEKRCIAIGPITAKELDANGINHEVCEEYTTERMVKHLSARN